MESQSATLDRRIRKSGQVSYPVHMKSGPQARRLKVRDILHNAAIRHETMLACLLLMCGFWAVLSPPFLAGPIGRMARENLPQTVQGFFFILIGTARMYGVLYQRYTTRIAAGGASAFVWLSFFFMSVGSVPPSIGTPIYLFLAVNSLAVVFGISKDE